MPFDNTYFKDNLQVISDNKEVILGVIFTYEAGIQIENGADEYNVTILSFARNSTMSPAREFSFPQNVDLLSEHSHTFFNYCQIMDPIYAYYYAVVSLWALAFLFHSLWTWVHRRQHSLTLQKIMVIIPIFFLAIVLLDYMFWKA